MKNKTPNRTTQKAIRETRAGKNIKNISIDELKKMNNAKFKK